MFTRIGRLKSAGLCWLVAALFFILPAAEVISAGTSPGPKNYFFQVWQTEEGLPQSHVTSIVQTRDGYLWLGTYNGLARFDGVRFVVFTSGKSAGLASSRVTSLCEDSTGTLWIGHEGGELTRYKEGKFEEIHLGERWPGGDILEIMEDLEKDLWLLHSSGLALRVRDRRVVPPEPGIDRPTVVSLGRDNRGVIQRVHGGKLRAIGRSGEVEEKQSDFVVRTSNARDGNWWVAKGERVWRLDEKGKWHDWGLSPWEDESLTCMMQSASGRLWVGTLRKGLFVLSTNGSHVHYTRADGLGQDWVRSLRQDREGTIWIGTGGGGLCAARERKVTMLQPPNGWQGRAVLGIFAARDGAMWFGTEGAGAYRFQNGLWEQFRKDEGLSTLFVWPVLEDKRGRIWAGTWGAGLFQFVDGKFVRPELLANERLPVCALFSSRDGTLWAGTQHGLLRITGDKVERIGAELARADVRTIMEAKDGTLWFGMAGGGLGRYWKGQLTQYREQDGLASDYVWSLLQEEDETLWIGTFGGGLCRLRGGKFSTFGEEQGLPSNVIGYLAGDKHGQLWMGSYAGILRASKRDLNECADGLMNSVNFFAYGPADGLESLECAEGLTPSGCQTTDGRLWFRTGKGPAVIDPENLRTNLLRPPVVIEEIVVDGVPHASTPGIAQIAPGSHRLDFRYTALSFVAPERVKFRYLLEGLEKEWVDGGGERTANYSFLPPGHYVFRVRACNNDGIWDEAGASLAFVVMPHFWQTWWFRAAVGLGCAGGVAGVVRGLTRRRYRQKLEQLERQRAIEKERGRIAEDIHDDIGARLTRITLLSQSARGDLDQPEQAAADLDQIYDTARELTKAMEEIVWAVNPRHDTLDSLVTYVSGFAQEFLSAAGVRCRLDVPMRLPALPVTAEARHNLFLAFKEAVNNVARHAGASEVLVVFRLEGPGFTLSVRDNGNGFATENGGAETSRGRTAPGNGLVNMRKRIAELGGECRIESAAGAGTLIRFLVPLESREKQEGLS